MPPTGAAASGPAPPDAALAAAIIPAKSSCTTSISKSDNPGDTNGACDRTIGWLAVEPGAAGAVEAAGAGAGADADAALPAPNIARSIETGPPIPLATPLDATPGATAALEPNGEAKPHPLAVEGGGTAAAAAEAAATFVCIPLAMNDDAEGT